jgi:hypothetical protein
MVANEAIMGDMSVGHDQAITADLRELASLDGSAMDGDVLTDHVAVADLQAGRFATIREVLGSDAYGREGIYLIVTSEACRAFEDDMRNEFAVFAHFDA